MRHFTALQLYEVLKTNVHPILLDVRESWEFNICHIKNSTLIPMNEIAVRLTELDPQQEIVVICHHGVRSRQVAMLLEYNGFNNIINLTGGIDAWAKKVDPLMPTY